MVSNRVRSKARTWRKRICGGKAVESMDWRSLCLKVSGEENLEDSSRMVKW